MFKQYEYFSKMLYIEKTHLHEYTFLKEWKKLFSNI